MENQLTDQKKQIEIKVFFNPSSLLMYGFCNNRNLNHKFAGVYLKLNKNDRALRKTIEKRWISKTLLRSAFSHCHSLGKNTSVLDENRL